MRQESPPSLPLRAAAYEGVADLRAFWEIIWMLGGGLLLTMATVGAAIVGLCALSVGGCALWLRHRKRSRPQD